MRLFLTALALLTTAAHAVPQTVPVPAPAPAPAPAPCPPELTAMAHRARLATGGTLRPGTAADIALRPAATVRFARPLSKPPKPDTYAGVVPVTIARAGTYGIALGDAAWVDMVRDGKTLTSTAHGHAAGCSGIRKIVDFVLTPGTYTIQIDGSARPVIAALVVARL